MASNFPTALDALTNPTATDYLNSPSHSGQHADANDAIEALQAKVGINSSAVTTSIDYLLRHLPTQLADLAMGTKKITGMGDPTAAQDAATKAYVDALTRYATLNLPTGQVVNGKIVVTVASNNITLALKGWDGNDPSATNPVYCRIGGVLRSVTAALSVTKNAGTNWMNAGGAELATKEIDYFAYLGYNATDGVVIGFSRIPFANQYSDFSTTTTNEKYCAISTITNAASTDYYNVIGRFAATLSAGAGYTWSVPTFTAINLIQRPIYTTRWLDFLPTITVTGGTSPTYTNKFISRYKLVDNIMYYATNWDNASGGTAGSGTGDLSFYTPFSQSSNIWSAGRTAVGEGYVYEGSGMITPVVVFAYTAGQNRWQIVYGTALAGIIGNDQSSTARFIALKGSFEI